MNGARGAYNKPPLIRVILAPGGAGTYNISFKIYWFMLIFIGIYNGIYSFPFCAHIRAYKNLGPTSTRLFPQPLSLTILHIWLVPPSKMRFGVSLVFFLWGGVATKLEPLRRFDYRCLFAEHIFEGMNHTDSKFLGRVLPIRRSLSTSNRNCLRSTAVSGSPNRW